MAEPSPPLHSRLRPVTALGLLVPLVLVLFVLDVALGSESLPLRAVLDVLLGRVESGSSVEIIVTQLRLPRALTAVFVGAGLSMSGLQMQTLFRNPLAGPYVLGISSGASLGVALVVLSTASPWLGMGGSVGGAGVLVLAATLGAAVVFGAVALVAVRVPDSATLLIIGLMFSSAVGAAVGVLQYFSQAERIQAFLIWTFGSLESVTWAQMSVFAPVVAVGLIIGFLLIKPLDVLLLGERYARSMGVRVTTARIAIIASTCLLAGSITAFCGPIAFLGLAVPHLTRALFDTAEHRILVPFVCLVGAGLALACDLVAHLPGSVYILPINAVTALIGAPVVVWVVLRRRNVGASF